MHTINEYPTKSNRLGDKALYTNVNTRNNQTLFDNGLSNLYKTKYFSGVDAEIYFGDIYIDEAVNINFSLQQNTLPIFGYNSYLFDTCAQGTRLIQGSFTVNFTKASYLYEVMNVLSVVNSGASLPDNNHACKNSKLSKSEKAPMWDKCFDIAISYGNFKTFQKEKSQNVNLSTMVILRGVYLIGCDQEFGTSQPNGKGAATGGIPLYETYYFYARDIEYDSIGNNDPKPEETPSDVAFEMQTSEIKLTDFRIEYSRDNDAYEIICDISHDTNIDICNYDRSYRQAIHVLIDGVIISLDIDEESISYNSSNTIKNIIASNKIMSKTVISKLKSMNRAWIPVNEIKVHYYFGNDEHYNSLILATNYETPIYYS